MKGKKWLILVASLATVLLASSIGVTWGSFVDLESSSGNTFQAWTSNLWRQTTQADFDAGVLTNVATTSSPGDGNVILAVKSDWYNASWQYRKAITFTSDTAKIPSTLTNFPVLINLSSDSDLAADAQDDGDDILFTSSNGTTKLDHEIEKFDGSTGELVAWVEVPSLSTGTVIYMYYGNSGASNQQNATGTWDGNFKMVQHLKDLTTSTTKDSTSNNNNGTKGAANQPIEVNAKIGKGQDFTPTTQYLQIGTTGFSASSGTVELWAKAEGFVLADPAQYLFGHTINPGWSSRIQLYTDDTLGNLNLGLGDSHSRALDIQALNTATWYHIVLTWNGTNYVVYVDSVSKATGTYAGLTSIESFADIGNAGQALERIEAWNGIIDEVRVSNSVRSAAWIKASYNNQNSPSTFYSLGGEVGRYVSSGTIACQVFDTTVSGARWDALFWDETLQSNTDITFEVRAANSLAGGFPDASWTNLESANSPITSGLPSGRYMQWRATLTTSDTSITPALREVRVYHY
jgi:hypothetical protein